MEEGTGKQKGQTTPPDALEREQKRHGQQGSQGQSKQEPPESSVWRRPDFSPENPEDEKKRQ